MSFKFLVADDHGARPQSRQYAGGEQFLAAGESLDRAIPVAFVGTYGPRRCGIATFTADLAAAVAGNDRRALPMVLAVTEPSGQYQYPAEVSSRFGRT